MAITNNGTKNLLPTPFIPAAYTRPTVTAVTDPQYQRTLTLSILKATVDEATTAATMTAIIDNATIGVTKQVTDLLALDFLGTATVTAHAELTAITHNLVSLSGDGDSFTDTAASYSATVKLYVKAL